MKHLLLLSAALALLLCGCAAPHAATQLPPHVERDTLYLHREHYDSIYILQDRYQDRSRDTVYLREHTVEYRYRLLHDTLREVRIDSIPYPVTVVRTQEVERPLGWFDHLTRFTFWTSAAALLLFIHLKIKK